MPAVKYLAAHVWFSPYVSGSSDPSTKSGTFTSIGRVNRLDWTPEIEERDIYAPDPAQQVLVDTIVVKKGLRFTIGLVECGLIQWQLAFGSLPLTAGNTQYNPLEGLGHQKGWVKVQWYDQNGDLFNTCDVFSSLMLDGSINFGEQEVNATLSGKVIASTLNSGVFVNVS
jgi:hypothetical protein